MRDIEDWWSAGESVVVSLGGVDRGIFIRRVGAGPSMTMLHGFPSSSHDWARVAPALAGSRALLMADFLGFGASDKPAEHVYSLLEQTDLIEALWASEGISSTVIVAHDYGVSVAQELLARRAEGRAGADLVAVCLLNGGLYPSAAQLQPGQVALLDPELGPQMSAAMTEQLFVQGLGPTFAADYDASQDSAEMWRALAHGGGQAIAHRLIRYVSDRAVYGERWIEALEQTSVPLSFIWGLQDPVSGVRMAEQIREGLPDAPFLALDDVGHWPALEVPERVARALLGA